MTARIELAFGGRGSVRETLSVGHSSNQVNIQWGDLIDRAIVLTEASTPPVEAAWSATVSLAAGSATLALDGLTRTGQTALDLTGKSVIAFVIHNLGAASMTVAGAGTNPYELFGDANGQMTLGAGGIVQCYQGSSLAAVSATVSDITVTGTGTQQFRIVIAAGDLTP